jgi:hypothetical protein
MCKSLHILRKKRSEVAIIKQWVPEGCQRKSQISRNFYFAGWPQAKFGSFLIIASPPTWQNWREGKKQNPPISEHVPIIKHFSIFFSFINQIRQFLCPWMHKLESYTCLLSVINKGATQKTLKEDELSSLSVHSPAYLPWFTQHSHSFNYGNPIVLVGS